MKEMKHRLKGAISIFLCIILLSNAALIGVLVDGARYRMAKAEAEAALDTAASSVLSYYNQMVYDLYGLFATDSLSEEQILSLMEDYTKKTLGVTPVDDSSVKQINQAIYNVLTGQTAEENGKTMFKGYDFDINVALDGNRNTLANTEAVEAQIIDHMKYRAPISLVSGVGDFLSKLEGLFAIVDRMQAAKDKAQSGDELGKEALMEKTATLLGDIEEFNEDLKNFSVSPDDYKKTDKVDAKDPWEYITSFDKMMDDLWIKMETNNPSGEQIEPDPADLERAYKDALDNLLEKFTNISANAQYFYDEANRIKGEVENQVGAYDEYIAKIQAKMDADPDNQNLKTVYMPEIELAQSSCGELLKNMDLILMGRQHSLIIADCMDDYHNTIKMAGDAVRDIRLGNLEKGQTLEEGYSIYLEKHIRDGVSNHSEGCRILLNEMKNAIHALNVFARDFEAAEEVKIKTEKNAVQPKKDPPKKDNELRDLVAENLKVPYQVTAQEDWYQEVKTEVSDQDSAAIIEAGLTLIDGIEKALEGARDSLYINEYAIAYFPNYVQHYKAADKPIATKADNAYLVKQGSYYPAFSASQAELEYIVTGSADAGSSVANISARLLGIRMALNTAAIFTDTAKIAQANTLAAAISGPFAPLVATGLLIAWALAESAIDVNDLLTGDDVYLFKQGANWKLSAGGAIKEVAATATEYVAKEVRDEIKSKIDDGAAAVENAANKALYEAYHKLQSGADSAMSAAENSMNQWSKDLGQQLNENGFPGDAQKFTSKVSGTLNSEAKNQINGMLSDANERAMAQLSKTVRNTSDKLKDKVDTISANAQEKLTDIISSSIEKYIPEGDVVSTGSNEGDGFDVKLNYMDYMRIFLLFMGNAKKVQHIQSLVQANMRYGKQTDFSMAGSYVSVGAKLEGSINFLMVSGPMMPASMRKDGRLNFTTYTHMGY